VLNFIFTTVYLGLTQSS